MPFGLALVASSLAAPGLTAAPVPPAGAVELTFTLDRKTYLPHEPILAEWGLTNVTNRDLYIASRGTWSLLSFECTDGNGDRVDISPVGTVCSFDPPPLVRLSPGQSLRQWLVLNGDYTPPPGIGRYTLRATGDLGYTFTDREHGERLEVRGEEVSFEVVKPEAKDAAAVRLIEDALLRDLSPRPGPGLPYDEVREWLGRRESECLKWPYNRTLCRQIAEQTESARFRGAARFWLGASRYNEGRPDDKDLLADASKLLTACRESEGASPYLKGLSGYYLLLRKLDDGSAAGRREARKLAEALIEENPKSFTTDKARQALDKLREASK
jgi:hypothetical protein